MSERALLKALVWKELLDLSRDRRTIIAVVVLPLIGLPGLALVTSLLAGAQTVSILIVAGGPQEEETAAAIRDTILQEAAKQGITVYVEISGPNATTAGYHVVLELPRGFTANLTSLDKLAVARISQLVGSQASELGLNLVYKALTELNQEYAEKRVTMLSELAGVKVDPGAVLDPVRVARAYHTGGGAPASRQQALVAEAARVLEFSLFFVVNPAATFMTDSIVGERDRRTIERVLLAPVPRRLLLQGKMIASALLGLAAAVADGIALIAFFLLAGMEFTLGAGMVLVWLLTVVLLILTTSSLVAIIASRSGSVRSAQNMSFLVITLAMIVYFAALVVDLTRIPQTISLALQLIPFTHAALIIHAYALGDTIAAIAHTLILAAWWLLLTWIAGRVFSSEKLLMVR